MTPAPTRTNRPAQYLFVLSLTCFVHQVFPQSPPVGRVPYPSSDVQASQQPAAAPPRGQPGPLGAINVSVRLFSCCCGRLRGCASVLPPSLPSSFLHSLCFPIRRDQLPPTDAVGWNWRLFACLSSLCPILTSSLCANVGAASWVCATSVCACVCLFVRSAGHVCGCVQGCGPARPAPHVPSSDGRVESHGAALGRANRRVHGRA